MRRTVLIAAALAAVGALAACTDHTGARSPADGSTSSAVSPGPDGTVTEGPGVTSAPPAPTTSPTRTPAPSPVPSLTLPPRPPETGGPGPIVPGPTTPDPK